jgi:hypothetical protein
MVEVKWTRNVIGHHLLTYVDSDDNPILQQLQGVRQESGFPNWG